MDVNQINRHFHALDQAIDLSYLDEGEGRPLLLVHGFTGTATADMGRLIEEFHREYRVIAPDLRGCGASRPPDRDFPPDFYQRDAADLSGLLDRLSCGPSIVLGYSDGAEVALLLASLRPDLVKAVVAWGVCGVISKAELESVETWLPVSDWGPERQKWREQIINRHGAHQLEPMITGWVAAAKAIYAAGGNISLGTADHIRCPVLLLNGDREVGNTPEDVHNLATRIPICQLVFVENCGHTIQDDQPEVLIREIRRFLNRIEHGADIVGPI